MSTKDIIICEIEQTPEVILEEILDFLLFLKSKHQHEKLDTCVLSESSLAKDWLTPEKNEAWQDLQKRQDRIWDVLKWAGAIYAGFSVCAAIALVGILLRLRGTVQ
jgi:hypothetical protein